MSPSTDIANPSADAVLRMLQGEMAAASPLPISEEGLSVLLQYKTAFETRLQETGRWQQEGGAVRHAARQLGIIASAVASLRREVEVTRVAVEEAARIVEANCSIGTAGRGRWCARDI